MVPPNPTLYPASSSFIGTALASEACVAITSEASVPSIRVFIISHVA